MDLQRGLITAYDQGTHTAAVMLGGSISRVLLAVPVSEQIPPHLITTGTHCAVAFFAEGSQAVVLATFQGQRPHEATPGWHDHFFGDQFDDRYEAIGSAGYYGSWPGGWAFLAAAAGVGQTSRIWLGPASGALPSLSSGDGWTMTLRTVSDVTSCVCEFGAANPWIWTRYIFAGVDTGLSPNWLIATGNAAGSGITVAPVAADGAMRIHRLHVSSTEVNHYVDGTLINTRTANIPTELLTPVIYIYNLDAANPAYYLFDYWILKSG